MKKLIPGDRINVRSAAIDTHHRTPNYIKGKSGRVQALCGVFPDPETRAYGRSGWPERALYRIEFEMTELWGDKYGGPAGDTLLIDVYEQWLAPA